MDDSTVGGLQELARGFPGLRLLLLVGSRARGEEHARSDVDLAYVADDGFDHARFLGEATIVIGTDDVDLADLQQANALFRYDAAAVGRRIVGTEDAHQSFRHAAVQFWCEAGPTIDRVYDEVLAGLDRPDADDRQAS